VTFGSPLSVRGKREGIVEKEVVYDVFFLLIFILVETVGF
jgi:hypothetical protein